MTKPTIQEIYTLCMQRYFYRDGILFSIKTNKPVGCLDRQGHIKTMIYFNGKRFNFAVHRLVYLIHHKQIPEYVDHINGIRTDNRIENLRPATKSENNRNRRVSKYSTSGSKGVIYNKNSTKPWNARIRYDGKMHSLGYFATIEEASTSYQKAAAEQYGEFAHHISSQVPYLLE